MIKNYTSDFMKFMNRFLENRPEVIEDQKYGWSIFWDRKVDPKEMEEFEESRALDDYYGFNPHNQNKTKIRYS